MIKIIEVINTMLSNFKFSIEDLDSQNLRLIFEQIKNTIKNYFVNNNLKFDDEKSCVDWLSAKFFKSIKLESGQTINDIVVFNEIDLNEISLNDLNLLKTNLFGTTIANEIEKVLENKNAKS